jgi:DNA-directed RNA polymerase subunit L
MARNCVEVLAKQIDVLCTRYQIEPPMSVHPAAAPENLDRLETMLA